MNATDRATAAKLVERWFEGAITNYEFDDAWPWKSPDKAVSEIGYELTEYYGDYSERALTTSSLSEEQLDVLKRCYDFLQTSLAYQYEVFPRPKTLREQMKALFKEPPLVITEEQKRYWPFSCMAERDQHQSPLPQALTPGL